MFWSLFNHSQKSQSNHEQYSLCCSLGCFLVLLCTHYRLLQCFSTYFCKLKEIRVLWSIFPDCYFLWLCHDVTDLVKLGCHWFGMVKNTKTWIFQERNITFLSKKKIINLCHRWHICRSYCCSGGDFIVRSFETGLGKWMLVVAVISDLMLIFFWLSETWPVTLRIQE